MSVDEDNEAVSEEVFLWHLGLILRLIIDKVQQVQLYNRPDYCEFCAPFLILAAMHSWLKWSLHHPFHKQASPCVRKWDWILILTQTLLILILLSCSTCLEFFADTPMSRVRREYLDQEKYNIMCAFLLSFQKIGAEFTLRKKCHIYNFEGTNLTAVVF